VGYFMTVSNHNIQRNMSEWRDLARSNRGLFRYYPSICLERLQKPWPTSVKIASVLNKLQTLQLTNRQWNKNNFISQWMKPNNAANKIILMPTK
jgi:hypothetical protein